MAAGAEVGGAVMGVLVGVVLEVLPAGGRLLAGATVVAAGALGRCGRTVAPGPLAEGAIGTRVPGSEAGSGVEPSDDAWGVLEEWLGAGATGRW